MSLTIDLVVEAVLASISAAVIGHLILSRVMPRLHKWYHELIGSDEELAENAIGRRVERITATVGIIERSIYASARIIGKPEVILVILGLKAAPALREWSERRTLGRTQFNIWLIGNLLFII